MSDSPLVSVLVPAYNAATEIGGLCDSLLAQTHSNFEVRILDDGSTDETVKAVEPYTSDRRFHVSGWKPNRGLNAGWRELLGAAQGIYWVSPGADDVLLPEFLERRVALMEAHPRAVIAHGAPLIIDEAGRSMANPFPALDFPARMDGKRALGVLLQHNIINQPSALVRSEVTRRVLPAFGFDWKYAPDWHLWILHLAGGLDLLWDREPLHQYRVHSRSLSCDPAKAVIRRAECRLVPVCALNAAAQFSEVAAEYWGQWRRTLYRLWLSRAFRLRCKARLDPEWIRLGGRAYYGERAGQVSLMTELFRHGPGIALSMLKEQRSLKAQSIRVSGLAQIDDPLFRLA